jgi:hypothetical protein
MVVIKWDKKYLSSNKEFLTDKKHAARYRNVEAAKKDLKTVNQIRLGLGKNILQVVVE